MSLWSWFNRAPRPVAGADAILQGFRRDADRFHALTEEEKDRFIATGRFDRPAEHRFIPYPDWRFGFDENEEIARIALRRQEEEGVRAHLARKEAAMGKRGRVPSNLVSAEVERQAWLAKSLKAYEATQQQIKGENWSFNVGVILGLFIGLLGGALGMFYILLLVGEVAL